MSDKTNNVGWVIPIICGIGCAIIVGGNKDTPLATIAFFVGAGASAYIIYRINNGSKY